MNSWELCPFAIHPLIGKSDPTLTLRKSACLPAIATTAAAAAAVEIAAAV